MPMNPFALASTAGMSDTVPFSDGGSELDDPTFVLPSTSMSMPAFTSPQILPGPPMARPPAMGLQPPAMPTAPQQQGPSFMGATLPILAAVLAGGRNPAAIGSGLAAFTQGKRIREADRMSREELARKHQAEDAEFYSRAIAQSQQIDDPIAFEQWKAAIAPVAKVHGLDANLFVFNNRALAARVKKEAAALLEKLDKQHPDGNYTAEFENPATGKRERKTRAELAQIAGEGAFDPVTNKPIGPKKIPTPRQPAASGSFEEFTSPDITPERRAQILKDRKDFGQADDRAPAPPKGGAAPPTTNNDLVQAVLDNPELYDRLTPTQIGKIAPALNAAGFKGFGKTMNESAITKIAESRSAIASLKDLRTTLEQNEQYIGPIAGLQALNPYSDARKAQAKIDLVKQRVGKALEGGVLRKEDEEKYKKILATLNDTPSTAVTKVDQLVQSIERDIDAFVAEQHAAGRRMNVTAPGAPKAGAASRIKSVTRVK